MPSLNQLFLSIVLPAIICAIFYIIIANRMSRDGEKPYLLWLTVVAVGLGYIIGYIALEGKPDLLPNESIKWTFYLSILAIGSSSYWGLSRLSNFITILLYSVILPKLLLDSYFQYHWGQFEGFIWWTCLFVGIFFIWYIVQQNITSLSTDTSCSFIYLIIATATALILALSGSLRLSLHAGILAGLFGIIWILTLILPRVTGGNFNQITLFPVNMVPVITILFVVIWLNGYFYAEVPSISAILIAISPIFAKADQLKFIQKMDNRRSIFIQIGLITLCVSVAIIIAVVKSGFLEEDINF